MATKIRHSYSLFSKRLKTAGLCCRMRGIHASVGCYSQYNKGRDGAGDIPTLGEVRKRFMQLLGVEPGFEQMREDGSHLLQYLPKSQDELPPRHVKDSFKSAIIPLRSNKKLRERYNNVLGQARNGRLMEDMDMFAAWVAINYIKNPKQPADLPTSPYIMVTILVDNITFSDYIIRGNMDIRISGQVSCVGKTSVEVTVWLEQDQQGTYVEITTAIFLMAARNANLSGGAIVNRLVPKDEEEKLIISQGEARQRQRIALDKGSIMTNVPHPEEQLIIHKLFVESIDTTLSRRVLPPGATWMSDTKRTNNIFSFTEDRNFHNTVFGGFLMRHAVEMAWFTSYFYARVRPNLKTISGIQFKRPVPLGSIICFYGQVTYTERNLMQIFVHGDVTNPFKAKPVTSIVFNFTYESPDIVSCVKPNTYYEAMMYIDGRRHFLEAMKHHRTNSS